MGLDQIYSTWAILKFQKTVFLHEDIFFFPDSQQVSFFDSLQRIIFVGKRIIDQMDFWEITVSKFADRLHALEVNSFFELCELE